jgi:hypothetical protein
MPGEQPKSSLQSETLVAYSTPQPMIAAAHPNPAEPTQAAPAATRQMT